MDTKKIILTIFKAAGLAMGVGSIVLGFFPDAADIDTHTTLLSFGLVALSLAALQKEE